MGHYIACKLYRIDVSYPIFHSGAESVRHLRRVHSHSLAVSHEARALRRRHCGADRGICRRDSGDCVCSCDGENRSRCASERRHIARGSAARFKFSPRCFIPTCPMRWLLLSPVGCAAWFGLFATALNLLPIWQLDGGHILYSLANEGHRRISIALSLVLIALGVSAGWAGRCGDLFCSCSRCASGIRR